MYSDLGRASQNISKFPERKIILSSWGVQGVHYSDLGRASQNIFSFQKEKNILSAWGVQGVQ